MADGYLFRFYASNLNLNDGTVTPLTREQIEALGPIGKAAIDLIQDRSGLNLSGQWGPVEDGLPQGGYPI